jgi:hypothetical protein
MAKNMVYESTINSKIKIKIQNTWRIAHKKLKKTNPTNLLGKVGKVQKRNS